MSWKELLEKKKLLENWNESKSFVINFKKIERAKGNLKEAEWYFILKKTRLTDLILGSLKDVYGH